LQPGEIALDAPAQATGDPEQSFYGRQATTQARPARQVGIAGKTFMMMLGRRRAFKCLCHRRIILAKPSDLASKV
jgi:hypothetical protein